MKHLTLKQARLQRGMSQTELARKAGIDQSQISVIERFGVDDVMHRTAQNLERALKLRCGQLVFSPDEASL